MPALIVATRNTHKTSEIRKLLGPSFSILDLSTRADWPEIIENGATFTENACLKALAISRVCQDLVLADDSGLEVDALDGAPGIFSARYAGEPATDQQNIAKLLQALVSLRSGVQTARFRCVIAVARQGKIIHTAEGCVEGTISDRPRGTGGFGYDPVFQPAGYDKTFGELPAETKNQISHRARALRALSDLLTNGP